MTVTALVMAGGKGTRMAIAEEKPMLLVGGKPVIEHVLAALKSAKKVNSIVVAVSDFTPRTTQYLKGLSVQVLKTPGKEYVTDMGYAVRALKLQLVLTVAADMPMLTGQIIDEIIEQYLTSGKPAMVVAVPFETKQKLGMSLSYAFNFSGRPVVPAGINVNDGAKIDDTELEQGVYIMDRVEVAVNINTVDELRIAEEQFTKSQTRNL